MNIAEKSILNEDFLRGLVSEFTDSNTVGFLMTGSYARNDATVYSDVDLFRFVTELPQEKRDREALKYRGGRLVSLSTTTVESKLSDISRPEMAGWVVPGLKQGSILSDTAGAIERLKKRAEEFEWSGLQAEADEYASRELATLAEEVYKIINGCFSSDGDTVFYGTTGLLLGLTKAVSVKFGVMVTSENTYFRQVREAAGEGWANPHRKACGAAERSTVQERAMAGLRLYVETAGLIHPNAGTDESKIIAAASGTIKSIFVDL